jgi:hypothetical protein
MSSNAPRYGTVDREYGLKLATTPPDEDGPIWMVNLMKYRDTADYTDGRETVISGREADDIYAPLDVLGDIGAEVVFAADVEQQLLGDAPTWDRVAIVKYPTRRSFIEMQSRPDFQDKHVHKEAGMATTIVSGCLPIPTPQGELVDWADVAHPPTAEDGPVVVIHVLKFDEAAAVVVTPDEMVAYQNAAALVAVPHGVRLNGWFAVEGTILGDGRSWDQIRFNEFPSKAAFTAVVTDPARLEAQQGHREVAIADTYTMILRPTINGIAESIG